MKKIVILLTKVTFVYLTIELERLLLRKTLEGINSKLSFEKKTRTIVSLSPPKAKPVLR